MRKIVWIILLCLGLMRTGNTQFLQLGEGTYSGTIGGPLVARSTTDSHQSKFAYIFPAGELGNLRNGDSIQSLEFYRPDGGTFSANCSLRIWIMNIAQSDWGNTPISFSYWTNQAKEIYHNHPQTDIGPDESFYKLPFKKPYVFDSVNGDNLALLVYFEQFDTLKGSFNFYFEGSNTIGGYYDPQVQYSYGKVAADSLPTSTQYHPTIRFNYPREDHDLMVQKVYTLGKLPVPLGNPDSVKVLLRNVGKKDISNHTCYTFTEGANTLRDSFIVGLKLGETGFFNVPSLNPQNKGQDTIYVVSADKNQGNDTGYSVRLANENIYSYRDITQSPAAGGIGFNGSQGDFVARFLSNKPKNLNQISVAFAASGRLFKLGIWEHDSSRSMPGKLIWDSDSLYSKAGTYIFDLPSPVRVNGSFYVGVRQLDLNNVSFGFQYERPVRPKTFFYTVPLGDTNWVDFYPNAPYKFIIEPRLQADYDFTVLTASVPKDTFDVYDKDTVAPTVTIANIGVESPLDSFELRCIIRGLSQTHYDESVFDTLSSGLKRTYKLPKQFIPKEYGEHTMQVIVSYSKDQVRDNDTFITTFYVGATRDAMTFNMFPSGNKTYVCRIDTIQTISTIMNIGFDQSPKFPIYHEIWMNGNLQFKDSQFLQLDGFNSQILVWPTYKCNDTGRMKLLVYTRLPSDRYPQNDTQVMNGVVYKRIDFAADTILSPSKEPYDLGDEVSFTGRVYNEGVLSIDTARVFMQAFDMNGNKVYESVVNRRVDGRFSQLVKMSTQFKPTKQGPYSVLLFNPDTLDIYPENDTLQSFFFVGRPTDFYVDSIGLPTKTSTTSDPLNINARVGNKGYDSLEVNGKIRAIIKRMGTVWYDEKEDIRLLPEEEKNFTFTKTFKPLFTGRYEVTLLVDQGFDINSSNDTLTQYLDVEIGKDALIVSVSEPSNNQQYYIKDNIDTIDVLISNQGIDTLKNINIAATLGFEKAIYYQKDSVFHLGPSDSVRWRLSANIVFGVRGKGDFRVIIDAKEDQNQSNDTFYSKYVVRSRRDWAILSIDTPSIKENHYTGQKYYPALSIGNKGQDSSTFSGKIKLTITKEGQDWYEETIPYPVLLPDSQTISQATQVVYFQEAGIYELLAYSLDNKDENPLNDTIRHTYNIRQNGFIQFKNDAMQVYPNPAKDHVLIRMNRIPQKVSLVNSTGADFDLTFKPTDDGFYVNLPSKLSGGVYYLKVKSGSEIYQSQLIILP